MKIFSLKKILLGIILTYFICFFPYFHLKPIYAQAPIQTTESTSKQALSQDISKAEIINDWIYYLDNELNNLLKNPYQISKDNKDIFEVIYKPDMFDDVLNTNIDSQITLPMSNINNSRENIYYIPSSSYKLANSHGKGFRFVSENVEILIPPNAIDMENDIAILRMEDDILKKQYSDYFIKITIKCYEIDKIQNNRAVSDAVEIKFETVYANKNIHQWNVNLQKELVERKNQYISSSNCKKAISRIISNNSSPRYISLEIEKMLNYGKREIVDITNRNAIGFVKVGFPLIDFYNPLLIVISNENSEATITGYEYLGGYWNEKEVKPIEKDQGMYISLPGAYGFAGRNINLYGDNMETTLNSPDIITKYHLDQFLGGKNIYVHAWTSRRLVVDCLSKIANIPVDTTSKDFAQPIQAQEALFLIMKLYEIKTNTEISSLKIQNQNSNMDFKNLNQKYEQSVKAAIELDLIEPANFEPIEQVTIGQFLTILEKLDNIMEI